MSAWRTTLESLVRERGQALFGYAYVLAGNRDDAEDLLQDALVRAFASGRHATSIDAAQVYVKKAIATAFIDRGRRTAARPNVVAEVADTHLLHADREGFEEGVHGAVGLHAALQVLTPRVRTCVVLRYMEDLRIDDVANTLGIAPGTVKRYLSDAIATLRTNLPELDFPEHDVAEVLTRKGGET